jgi:hypothetical protein
MTASTAYGSVGGQSAIGHFEPRARPMQSDNDPLCFVAR